MNARFLPLLERIPLFTGLASAQLEQLARICRIERYGAGDIIFQEQDQGTLIYIVYIGAVEICLPVAGSDGVVRLAPINTMFPGQLFGEVALLDGATHTATARAAQPSSLLALRGADLVSFCERDVTLGYRVAINLAADLAAKLRTATLLLRGPVKWRDGELGLRTEE